MNHQLRGRELGWGAGAAPARAQLPAEGVMEKGSQGD
jgi:hypothetical protein